jgi:pyruvate-formate lyase-activating enzyme
MSDFYCSEKFWWMSVNLEKRTISSCCSASSVVIDQEWMKSNSGELFNYPSLVDDRKQMLDNKPCASCHETCWSQESKGLPSKRTSANRGERTHLDIHTRPEVLNLHVGSTCNMSCTYCGIQNSSTWFNDVNKHGTYGIVGETRFVATTKDIVVSKLGQKMVTQSNPYTSTLVEVKKYKDADSMDLTGGEPLLHNNLADIISDFPGKIRIHTGLGIDSDRLVNVLKKFPLERTRITVSAENINELYEFNRYGNTYSRLLRNLEIVKSHEIPVVLRSTLSNLTIFGFSDFLNKFSDSKVAMYPCVDVPYLGLHVLDAESKQRIANTDYGSFTDFIHKAIETEPTDIERKDLKTFLFEFARRRNLDVGIFPKTFIEWISQSK